MIGNIPIEEEEARHPAGRDMSISGSIQGNSMISEPFLVTTNFYYFCNSDGSTEADVLAKKVIFP